MYLIRRLMTYAYRTLDYAVNADLLKLQRLQNRVRRATGNLDMCSPVRQLHVSFKTSFAYYYTRITNYAITWHN
jgi:hypothetical protein